MKFLHIADCHIGAWRHEKMQALSLNSFEEAIEIALQEQVDFLLIAGDLFNTSMPSIDKLKFVIISLKKLKNAGIETYIIPGSHDFSPSGKTMLDILEEAELLKNVFKGCIEQEKIKLEFTIDKKTGAKITGILGKKGMLDKQYYKDLFKENLEQEEGFKIFMFHTAITELKTSEMQEMDSFLSTMLPKNFNYYAGGHVHIINKKDIENKKIVYPGPTFPNSFSEIEILNHGNCVLYDNGEIKNIPLIIKKVEKILIDANNKSPNEVTEDVLKQLDSRDLENKIITLRFKGVLGSGKTSEIEYKKFFDKLYEEKAYFALKNSNKLLSKDFIITKIIKESAKEIEEVIIKENVKEEQFIDEEKDINLINQLMSILSLEKEEGETKNDYEIRVIEQASEIIEKL